MKLPKGFVAQCPEALESARKSMARMHAAGCCEHQMEAITEALLVTMCNLDGFGFDGRLRQLFVVELSHSVNDLAAYQAKIKTTEE